MRTRKVHLVATISVAALCVGAMSAWAQPGSGRSDNVEVLAQKRSFYNGAQIAADGNLLAVAGISPDGRLQHLGEHSAFLFEILPRAPWIRELGSFRCWLGRQSDISLWNGYLIESAGTGPGSDPVRDSLDPSPCEPAAGLRIVDISTPNEPREVSFTQTACAFNHTLVPASGRLYIYGSQCNRDPGQIGIYRLDEETGHVTEVSRPQLEGDPVCNDITYFEPKAMIACAAQTGLSASALYDVSDPANPRLLAKLPAADVGPRDNLEDVPAAEIVASQAQFTWDGRYLAIIDRATPNAAIPNCGGQTSFGDLFFYEISDPRDPVYRGRFTIDPSRVPTINHFMQCSPYRFNVLPMKDPRRYVAVISWQNQGLTVVDFSDPDDARELAWFQPDGGIVQTSYWYNGRVYASDFAAPANNGLWVLRVAGLGARDVRYFKGPFNATTQVPRFR